ncbi:GNAT superfamily N-acetyltransferase [Phycicoccus badiiscoriae]|uniref:GNAT superfamily N-acetyltransferase n=1 Tax=Pedococcus badiiscoriae TaxID=642776 RepID=A0A852WC58_9MICO|nr:GNAT family N-acetyltransferase [Pedococcus badiiscoriae]NYG06260.1 GNAT superfamily N-acetyltransferase [Pedococcus badiiscoriae]
MSTDVSNLPLGSRVVVRWRLEVPDPATGATLTDAVGTLVRRDAATVSVETSRGEVTIARDRITAAKELPPKPSRRGAAHLALSVEDLQRVMIPSWGAVERATLGDWALRASAGYTQRGNSVVPVGSPARPLLNAVTEVETWYAARGLPAKFALAGPQGFDPAGDPLGAVLLTRGYTAGSRTLALTAARETVAAADPGGPALTVSRELGPEWLEAHRGTRATVPGATEAVLLDSPRVLFGSITPGGGLSQQLGLRAADAAGTAPIALARLGIGAGWAGLGAVWTDPAYRGRGLAAHLTAGLAARLRQEDIALLHLQVEHDNDAALRLYRRLGFDVHSSYVYLTAPLP